MKILLAFSLLTGPLPLSFAAPAANTPAHWDTLEVSQFYTISKDLTIAPTLAFKKGMRFKLSEITGLAQINVVLYSFNINPCPDSLKSRSSEMVIIDNQFGVQLSKECKFDTWVEDVDLGRASFYEKAPIIRAQNRSRR